jgi:hypothetical protein
VPWAPSTRFESRSQREGGGEPPERRPGAGRPEPAEPPPQPQPPPEPELPDRSASLEQRVEFLDRHRNLLGPQQRGWLEELRARLRSLSPEERARQEKRIGAWEDVVEGGLKRGFAQQLSALLGFPVDQVGRIPATEAGIWERIVTAVRTGRRVTLSITSHAADGEPVQLDGYDVSTRSVWETKDYTKLNIPENLTGKEYELALDRAERRLVAQMEKQARFARDYNLKYFEWDVPPELADYLDTRIRTQLPKSLGDRIRISQEGLPNVSE